MKRIFAGIILVLLLTGMLALAFSVKPVRASGTIYIRADGSIDPPDSPITTLDNMTYTLIGNITSSIDGVVVERDNIVVDGAGYTIQGTDGEAGIYLSCRSNVTIENISIRGFDSGVNLTSSFSNSIVENEIAENGFGITLYNSSSNTIAENNMTGNYHLGIDLSESSDNNLSRNNMVSNDYVFRLFFSSRNSICRNNIADNNRGIWLFESSNNIVSVNKIIANVYYGIMLDSSSNNIVSQNDIEEHTYQGIHLYDSSSNSIFGNNIVNNRNYGIWIDISSWNNSLFHNNFINNTRQVALFFPQTVSVSWDSGYPSGGNYWSNYTGVDMKNGLYQNETGGDGIGDVPHVVGPANMDNYPLMHPWSSLPVHNMNTGLGYETIQGAIDANETLNGHSIFVEAGTYYENVVVNKTIYLEGENRETTIINAGSGVGIKVVANDSRISGFTVCNAWGFGPFDGAIVVKGFDNVISDDIVESNHQGIVLLGGGNNTLRDNMIVNNRQNGLVIGSSSNNTFRNNAFVNNSFRNLELMDPCFPWYVQDIDISNTVNGKPIIYLAEKQNLTVSPDIYPQEIGILMLINSTNMVVEGFNISYSENSDYPGLDYNVFLVSNVNLTIRNNTISHGGGIVLDSSNRDVFISNNTLHNNRDGIYGIRLRYTYITQNIFYNNYQGIMIQSGSYNTIWENTFYNNTHEVLTCTGIILLGSQYTVIVGNNFTSNDAALIISGSSFNTVYGNNITNNGRGITIYSSIGNTIAHNNFINNTDQVDVLGEQINIWDDGYPSGGNYWSNYTGVDLHSGSDQDETGSDGIGDTPHIIDANNRDRYPLMGPFNVFDAGVWDGTAYNVDVVSNSTVSEFQFNPSEGALLRFNVTGDDGTSGFCRVTIPKDLLWVEDGWTVLYGSFPLSYKAFSDENYTYLYFAYTNPSYNGFTTVTINGTHVIPEFQSFLILALFMMTTLLAVIVYKRKHSRSYRRER